MRGALWVKTYEVLSFYKIKKIYNTNIYTYLCRENFYELYICVDLTTGFKNTKQKIKFYSFRKKIRRVLFYVRTSYDTMVPINYKYHIHHTH